MLPMMEGHKGEALEQMLRTACEGALGSPLPRSEQEFRVASDKGKGTLFNCAERVAVALSRWGRSGAGYRAGWSNTAMTAIFTWWWRIWKRKWIG